MSLFLVLVCLEHSSIVAVIIVIVVAVVIVVIVAEQLALPLLTLGQFHG